MSALLAAAIAEDPDTRGVPLRRLCSADSFVPLGPAADAVLLQTDEIVAATRELAGEVRR